MTLPATKNLIYNANGTIDMEIDHPTYGLIPFTASPNDTEQLGKDLYAAAIAGTLGIIAPYVQSLSDAQSQQLALMDSSYAASVFSPISCMGTTFQADQASQDLIASVLTAAGGALPAGFAWYDVNNAPVTMTFAQLQGLAASILGRGQPLFIHKQTQKTAIRAATAVAQVQAVTW